MRHPLNFRQAKLQDAAFLSKISFESKAFWNYPQEYFKIWEKELLITPKYIRKNKVIVAEFNQKIVGYYSVVLVDKKITVRDYVFPKGMCLEHFFICPEFIRKGVGALMFRDFRGLCRQQSVSKVFILVDPNAKGFYEKMGCEYQCEVPSTIPQRTTPLFMFYPQSE